MTHTLPRPKAYSYIRMSTDIQLKGDSLRRQKEASLAYAVANDLALVEDFQLEDIGRSAFSGEHVTQGALGLFLHAIEEGAVERGSFLIVESLDRLSRDIVESAALQFLKILSAGVNIVTLSDQRVYMSGQTTFADIIYSVVVMSRAHEESKTKSLRVGAAWENKRKQITQKKLTKVAPVWLKLSDDRKHFDIDEASAETVKAIFNNADAGKGSYQICRSLNLSRIPPIGKSNGWHESFVSKILTNRAVIGEFQPHCILNGKRVPKGDPVIGYFPSIIDAEQFERIQLARKLRKTKGAGAKGKSYTNLFSGVGKCGYCGGRLLVLDKGSGPKGGMYLRCDNARRGHGCKARQWPLRHFETAFLYYVKEIDLRALASDESRDAALAVDRAIAAKSQERSDLMLVRDRTYDMLSQKDIDLSYLTLKLQEVSRSIAASEQDLQALAQNRTDLIARRPNSEIEIGLLIERMQNYADFDTRAKVADWIRTHVRELLLYSDGLDPESRDENGSRTFSVLFETEVFRTVTVSPSNPKHHHLSIFASGDEWREE